MLCSPELSVSFVELALGCVGLQRHAHRKWQVIIAYVKENAQVFEINWIPVFSCLLAALELVFACCCLAVRLHLLAALLGLCIELMTPELNVLSCWAVPPSSFPGESGR